MSHTGSLRQSVCEMKCPNLDHDLCTFGSAFEPQCATLCPTAYATYGSGPSFPDSGLDSVRLRDPSLPDSASRKLPPLEANELYSSHSDRECRLARDHVPIARLLQRFERRILLRTTRLIRRHVAHQIPKHSPASPHRLDPLLRVEQVVPWRALELELEPRGIGICSRVGWVGMELVGGEPFKVLGVYAQVEDRYVMGDGGDQIYLPQR